MILYHIYESCPFLSVLINIDMHLSEKSGSIIFWENFFLIFVPFIVSLLTQLTQRLILCLWDGGVGVGGRVENVLTKIQFFRLVLELYLNAEFFQLFGLQHFQLLLFGFPICNKTLFQFCPRQP